MDATILGLRLWRSFCELPLLMGAGHCPGHGFRRIGGCPLCHELSSTVVLRRLLPHILLAVD